MKEQILEWVRTLAKSQGFYCRLLEEFENNPEYLDNIVKECEERSIKDIVDFIIYIEN